MKCITFVVIFTHKGAIRPVRMTRMNTNEKTIEISLTVFALIDAPPLYSALPLFFSMSQEMIVKSKWQIIKKSMKKSFLAALINRFYREIQTNIFRIYDFL